MERDTTLSQISRTERIEKGGAVLAVESGRLACVEFEPISGTFVGYTPLPDPTAWKLEVPGGITVEPDGKVGLMRVTLCPRENRITVEQAHRPGDAPTGLATALRVRGMTQPKVILNGRAVSVGQDGRIALRPE
ncbi:MAG: hypothetical protein NTX87_07775 [Planctomycetota bacterium]|nr:hypothetical protein [Planctomycetota bacterium]